MNRSPQKTGHKKRADMESEAARKMQQKKQRATHGRPYEWNSIHFDINIVPYALTVYCFNARTRMGIRISWMMSPG